MRLNRMVAIAALVALTAGPLIAQKAGLPSDDAAVLLQAAMHKEQVEGRLPEAIEAYKAVVTKAGSNKSLAAKALAQLAAAYEKLGRPEARATYQTIVRDYSDQPAIFATAKTHLAAAAAARGQLEVTPRRVLDGGWAGMFDISADGRFTVGPERVGYSGYSIVLRNVVTGLATTLVPGSVGRGGFQARLSDDGRQVAYSWSEEGQGSLRIIGTAAGSVPIVIETSRQAPMVPVDWSPDGRSVLVAIRRYGDAAKPQQVTSSDLAWVAVESKSIRTIKTFESWQDPYPGSQCVSPDGRFVAFTVQPRSGSTDRYLYVIDANGQRETAIVTAAGRPDYPIWTPDGSHLLFVTPGTAESTLWSVGVQNGQATGEPQIVQSRFSGDPLGMTTSGTFYYTQAVGGGNYEYVVNRSASPGERPITFVGLSASWSRSGSVAFVRRSGEGLDLIVRNVATGQERSFQHSGLSVVSPRWFPDESGVIVTVNEPASGQSRQAFYFVDVRTGTFRRLFDRDNGRPRTAIGTASPDGKTLYLGVRNNDASGVTGIVGVDLATGVERPVATFDSGTGQSSAFGLAINPDGTTLAVASWTRANAAARIFTVGVDGSNYHEIVGSFDTGWLGDTIRWTPDGRSLLFVAFDASKQWRIMRVPAEGGQPEFDGLGFNTLAALVPELDCSQATSTTLT